MVTGIATRCWIPRQSSAITGQVGSKLIGSDAFQETDITGVTLPITKHNYWSRTQAKSRAQSAKRFTWQVRPARSVLVDITKDAQQSTCEFDGKPIVPQLPDTGPISLRRLTNTSRRSN